MNRMITKKEYRPKGALPIIDTSKAHHRDLKMYVSSDLPRIKDMITNVKNCNLSNPNINFKVKTDESVHSRVTWKNEDDDAFGFECQITQSDKLLLVDTLESINNPAVFRNGSHRSMMIIIEGSGVNIPVNIKPPTPESKLTMFIAAGENTLMAELKTIFEKIYPGKSSDVVKMIGLHCGGDVNWQLNETGEQVGLIVERKKADDLIASRMDGREAQLPVMLENSPDPSCIFIIVEGNVMSTRSAMDEKAKMSTIVYPLLRDGINMASVSDTASTAALLVNMHLQMEWCEHKKLDSKNFHFGRKINQGATKSTFTEPGGKEEMVYTLSVIKGISDDTAAAIAKRYPTFLRLFLALMNAEDPETLLAELPIPREGSNIPRRLGKAAARAILSRYYIDDLREKLKLRVASVHAEDKQREDERKSQFDEYVKQYDNRREYDDEYDDNDDNNNNNNNNNNNGHRNDEGMEEEEVVKVVKKPKSAPLKWKEPTVKKLGPVFEKAKKAAEITRKRKESEKKTQVDLFDDDDDDDDDDKSRKKKKVKTATTIDLDDDFFK